MTLKKLDARGFSHDVLIVLFVVIFAIAGVGYLVASHADDCSAVSAAISKGVSVPASAPASGSTSGAKCATSGPVTAPATVVISPPTNLAASKTDTTSTFLTWTPATASAGHTVASYNIYRFVKSAGISTAQLYAKGIPATNAASVVSLTPGTSYGFYLVAYDGTNGTGQASVPSAPVYVTTLSAGPTAPANLKSANTTSDSTFLSWSPSTDASSTITGYSVYRYLASAGQASAQLYAKGGTATSATFVGLNPGTAYGFYVIAVDASGHSSPPSAPVIVQTATVSQPSDITVSPLSFSYSHANIVNPGKNFTTMYWNAVGTKTVQFSGTIVGVTVNAKGDQCKGAPQLQVMIDNQQALNQAVASTSFTNYSAAVNAAKGQHTIRITFPNDYMVAGSCDRNLYVQNLVFHQN